MEKTKLRESFEICQRLYYARLSREILSEAVFDFMLFPLMSIYLFNTAHDSVRSVMRKNRTPVC